MLVERERGVDLPSDLPSDLPRRHRRLSFHQSWVLNQGPVLVHPRFFGPHYCVMLRLPRAGAARALSWVRPRRHFALRHRPRYLAAGGSTDEQPSAPQSPANPSAFAKYASYLPGVALAGCVSEASFLLADQLGAGLLRLQGIEGSVSSPISGIPVAIVLGLALGNATSLPKAVKPGLAFSTTTILRTGIVCVGAKLSAMELAAGGLVGLPVVVACIGSGLAFVPWFGRKMNLPPKMSSLIAAGTSICGVTAITAVAPVIKANEQEVSYAVANVVAFGTCGLLMYPYMAHAVFEHSQQVGLWLGVAIHDTSQVIGSALTYHQVYDDEVVLKTATITKLTRNVFLAGVIPALALAHIKHAPASDSDGQLPSKVPTLATIRKYIPMFVYGFAGMACLRSVGDMTLASHGSAYGLFESTEWNSVVKTTGGYVGSHLCLGTAMAAVGLNTNMAILRKGDLGMRPFIVGSAGCLVVGGVGFASITALTAAGFL